MFDKDKVIKNQQETAKLLNEIEGKEHAANMSNFIFSDKDLLGHTYDIDTGRLTVKVNNINILKDTSVGRLTVIDAGLKNSWLVGRIEKVYQKEREETGIIDYFATIGLIGSFSVNVKKNSCDFSRALVASPKIEANCYLLENSRLSIFMKSISKGGTAGSLTLGKYGLDNSVKAYMDGDKLFQRHMALVGTTGCGKSWTVATLVEQISKLQTANVVIFDIHGEYRSLDYAAHYRIASPGDLENPDENVLFMPCWFMTHEELMTIFLDTSDNDSPTHSLMTNEIIRKRKLEYLNMHKKTEVLKSFTADSPIPYDFNRIMADLKYLNTELVPGIGQGEVVKGPFYGKFDRFLPKLEARMSDRRYGFMFGGPKQKVLAYDYINEFIGKIFNVGIKGDINKGIKVIDFSRTPSEMLPVIIGVIGRFLFAAQFWNEAKNRHPIILVCDEAHLYLPTWENCNEAQKNTVFQYGRIAKEGRKYGVTLAVVTQRPSDVNTSILSQCGNLMTLRLGNAVDQQVVSKLMPDGMVGLIDELPLLGIGEIIVVGDALTLPLKIKVDPPGCAPTSVTPDYCSAWAKPAPNINIDEGIDNMRKQSRKKL